jgi:hypothetical protein
MERPDTPRIPPGFILGLQLARLCAAQPAEESTTDSRDECDRAIVRRCPQGAATEQTDEATLEDLTGPLVDRRFEDGEAEPFDKQDECVQRLSVAVPRQLNVERPVAPRQ